jgi:hypothetical protein
MKVSVTGADLDVRLSTQKDAIQLTEPRDFAYSMW